MAENNLAPSRLSQGLFNISILQMHPSPTYTQSHGKYAEPYRQPPVSLLHPMALPIHNSVCSNAPILPHAPAMHSGISGPLVGGTPVEVIRYPLPMMAPAILGDARHKRREIKRRSKTGCMTCRKRRIKCDESLPICKNCTKSRRNCLGYPVFKTQTGQPSLQPATPTTRPYSRSPPNVPDSSATQQPPSVYYASTSTMLDPRLK
jgi:hypothetical protein